MIAASFVCALVGIGDLAAALDRAWAALDAGDPARAVRHVERALDVAPQSPVALFALASARAELGERDAALDALEAAARAGYAAAEVAQWHLAELRGNERFEAVLVAMRANAAHGSSRIEHSPARIWPWVPTVVSPDGTRFVREGLVWDVASGLALASAPEADWLRLRDDGRIVAGTETRVWVTGGGPSLEGFTPRWASTDGGLVVCDGERTVLWDARTGDVLAELELRGVVEAADATQDGARAVLALADEEEREVVLADLRAGKVLARMAAPDESRAYVGVGPGGEHAWALWGDRSELHVLAADGTRLAPIEAHAGRFVSAELVGAKVALTAGSDGRLVWWDVRTGESLRSIEAHGARMRWSAATFGRAANVVVTSAPDEPARAWDSVTGVRLWERGADGTDLDWAWSSDGERAFVAHPDGDVECLDARSGRSLFQYGHMSASGAIASPERDLSLVALEGPSGDVHGFEPASGRIRWSIATGAPLYRHALAPSGRWLATASFDGRLEIWDVAALERIHDAMAFESDTLSIELSFSRDGERLLALGERSARVVEIASGAVLTELAIEGERISSGALSASGERVALGTREGTVAVWHDGNLRQLGEHGSCVASLAFAPDGALLASGGEDAFAVLWSLPEGRRMQRLEHTDLFHPPAVRVLEFSKDGTVLVASTGDWFQVFCWDVATGALRWNWQPRGGQPAAPCIELDEARARIFVTSPWSSVALDVRDGSEVAQLRSQDGALPFEQAHLVYVVGERVLVDAVASLVVLDADSLEPTVGVSALGGGEHVVVSRSGRFDASEGALAKSHLLVDGEPRMLDALAGWLFDPAVVRAEAAGVLAAMPFVPRAPEIVLVEPAARVVRTDASSATVRVVATGDVAHFEVDVNGELSMVAGAHDLVLEVALDGERTDVRVRAAAASGLLSGPALVTFVRR